jgi:menaquinol-cytochrome c reductase cytochrome b/c subunit
MPRYTARERRERYLREYDFQKKSGKPFFPNAMFHDTIASLFFLALIMGLAIWWYADFGPVPDNPTGERAGGILGPAYEAQADPGVEEYDPRPEWYFFFLFELLRIFKTPELLIFATVIIPTLWMILLIAWPFLDRRPERRVSRRPIAMAIGAAVPIVLLTLTWYGSKAPSVGAASNHPGAFAFARTNACGTCHTLADAGTGGNIGPNLDSAQPDFETAKDFITNGRGGMPAFGDNLSEDQINCMAGYVATWAGAQGETPGPNADGAAQVYPSSCETAGGDYAPAGG